ncbi:LOW QUALITY PROTEIN: calponin homology domain-containing protein DDB_G0272472-like [Phymastichus coffea]|uniref:LOW QUALITY PROTEIN: calponin homology domain-containing protein DDB_G0272472-like n=1 Tax=Phymastichus coffea TaxID=108790 RepID=UPI00273CCE88|nr:LOW QUALITY PROTEIN: calponin homology domain-containing protein DDB_G0272472-like [Phymastichus coffea]
MPAVVKRAPDQLKPKKKKKIKKIKPRVLKLKRWLKTPEDWAQFDAWVKVNALPRKLPDPEPIIRKAVKLRQLNKRLKVLSKPIVRPVTQCVKRLMTRNIRCAQMTKRTRELAFPKIRMPPECVELGCVKRSALRYRATENMLLLSQPKIRPMVECKSFNQVCRRSIKRKTSERTDELAIPLKRRRLNDQCEEPEAKCQKTGEVRWIFGTNFSFLSNFNLFQLSSWMEFLAIPSYRKLIGQETEKAQKWRDQIIEELEPRGKQAYEEQMKRRAELKRREEERRCKEERQQYLDEQRRLEEEAKAISNKGTKVRLMCKDNEDEDEDVADDADQDVEYQDAIAQGCEDKTSKNRMVCSQKKEETEEEQEARKKRQMEKNAWRFEVLGVCTEFPRIISEAAKNCKATPTVEKLAVPKKYKGDTCKDPYKISECAKAAQASPLTEALAKPKYQAEPVTKSPPREKDEFGMPIYPKPVIGKVMPERKPYPEAECKTEEEKEEERKAKEEEKQKKKKPIDRIVFELTIDPVFDPRAAKKQAKERERAAQEKAEKEAADPEMGADGEAEGATDDATADEEV